MQRITLMMFTLAASIVLSGCHEGVHGTSEHSHENHSGEHELALNNGSKWETDEPLRHAMTEIRKLVKSTDVDSIDVPKISSGVETNIDYMVRNCKLEPQADGVLHVIIGEMVEGVTLIKKTKGNDSQGLEQIESALQTYSHYFDHPGWEDLHAH